VLVAVVAAVAIGWLFARGDGTVRRGSWERIRPDQAGLPDDSFGPRGTLLLFTTPLDTRRDAARAVLAASVEREPGVWIAEVDLRARPALTGRFAVTRTPTVFVLDGDRRLRFRMKGVPKRTDLATALASVAPPG